MTLATSGCRSSDPGLPATSPGVTMIRTELYFGLDRAGPAPDVSDEEWQQFVREVVTPRFPEGLTVLSAVGQWRDTPSGNVVREPSRIVIILRPMDRAQDSDRAIEEIRGQYSRRFTQDTVLRVDAVVRAEF